MSKITLGKSDGRDLKLDLDLLISSRLLIQANSGGGKSWLLRRIAEQCWGKVQVILIDPEGEFFTLREKFGYVLVGENGETPADVRSAALLAEKFLQLKASAVCDLYEAFRGRPMEQRQWVRVFLDALIGVPRTLWHPVLVIVDEAHKFCPQETPKAGNQRDREIISECKNAMISLSTTGRKRGFCAIWATQRLAKVDKDASAEMFNRLVGMTIEDVDVDRAADLMSVTKSEKQDFRASLRTLSPGEFYAFGRAITTERKLVKVGDVQTHHPETGKAAKNAEAPPMPAEVKGLLPQLSDLPKQAEEKARTEAEFKKTIRELRQKLTQAEKAQPKAVAGAKPDPQQARQLRELRALLGETMKIIAKVTAIGFDSSAVNPDEMKAILERTAKEIGRLAESKIETRQRDFERAKAEMNRLLAKLRRHLSEEEIEVAVNVTKNEPVTVMPARPVQPRRELKQFDGANGFSASQVKILSRLVELLECTGQSQVRKEQLAAWSEYSPNSGGFNNYLGSLRSAGMIDYPAGGYVAITEEGRKHAQPEEVPVSSEEMLGRAKEVLGGSEGKLLEHLHRERRTLAKTELAEATGFSPNSGGFNNYLGHMRTLGFIEYPSPGAVRASDWLYL